MSKEFEKIRETIEAPPKQKAPKESLGKVRKLPDAIADLLKKDPKKAWGITEIAQKLKLDMKNKSSIHYHLQKFKKQNLVKKSEDGNYSWNESAVKEEEILPLLVAINDAGGRVTSDEFRELKEKILKKPADPELSLDPTLHSKFLESGFQDEGEDVFLNSEGAHKLGVCLVCGKKLTGEHFIIAQEIPQIGPRDEFGNERFVVHARCAPRLYGLQVEDWFSCEECGLPLAMTDLLRVLRPETSSIIHDILMHNLSSRELNAYEMIRSTTRETERGQGWYEFMEEVPYYIPSKWGPGLSSKSSYVFNSDTLADVENLLVKILNYDIIAHSGNDPVYENGKMLLDRANVLHNLIIKGVKVEDEEIKREILEYFYGKLGVFFSHARRGFLFENFGHISAKEIIRDAPCVHIDGKRYHPECHRRMSESISNQTGSE